MGRAFDRLATQSSNGAARKGSDGKALVLAVVAIAAGIAVPGGAQARLVRINPEPPVVIDLPVFGATGPYLKISGTFDGELDPADLHNAPIADIDLAPRVAGKVRYTS